MTVKSIVIEMEVEYLQQAAKERGVSRAKLVRLLMQKVVKDELVPNILGDDNLEHAEPPPQKYRRFRNREHQQMVVMRGPSLSAKTSPSGR